MNKSARACCALAESGFANRLEGDSIRAGGEGGMDDATLL
jgi:hypothetical protein